jgi:hypothetical protein
MSSATGPSGYRRDGEDDLTGLESSGDFGVGTERYLDLEGQFCSAVRLLERVVPFSGEVNRISSSSSSEFEEEAWTRERVLRLFEREALGNSSLGTSGREVASLMDCFFHLEV